MITKRRKSLSLMAKMRKIQQKRKGKQKVLWEYNQVEPHQCDDALVTFIEKFDDDDYIEGGLSATMAGTRPNSEQVQFYLKDGRLDVAEVLDHLDTVGLQYESKPRVWRDLKTLKSGKSAQKFKNKQEVYFRRTGLRKWEWPWKSRGNAWVDEWLVEGDTRKIYCGRVSRLFYDDGKGVVGTAIRFENPYGLLMTAHHCCTYEEPTTGEVLSRKNLLAFGTPVEIVHLSDKYDLAFLLLKSGPYAGGFRLATTGEEKRGRKVRMLSFPWHVDKAFGFDHANVDPTEVHGHIANLGPEERKLPLFVDALATYMGGFAASPGGAVTISSKVMVGMHIRRVPNAAFCVLGEIVLFERTEMNIQCR